MKFIVESYRAAVSQIRELVRFIVFGCLAVTVLAAMVYGMVGTAGAAPAWRLYFHRGYSVQGSWLCYGWSNGAFHCTQHWRRSGSGFISYNQRWVPSNRSASVRATTTKFATTGGSKVDSLPLRAVPRMWGPTGYGAYGAWWGGDGYVYGQCTAGARFLSGNHIPTGLGNAKDWAYNARRRGMYVSSVPRVGSTVVYQPGVQGASWLGHVGHVVGVYSNGWFLAETENDGTWAGGGYNRVDFRWGHTGAGVQFIY